MKWQQGLKDAYPSTTEPEYVKSMKSLFKRQRYSTKDMKKEELLTQAPKVKSTTDQKFFNV